MGTWIYAGGHDNTGRVYKYDSSDMSKLAQSEWYCGDTDSDIYHLAQDGTYIYAGGSTKAGVDTKLVQYDPSDLSIVAQSGGDIGAAIRGIVCDDDYVYTVDTGGAGNGVIRKFNQSDLAQVDSQVSEDDMVTCVAEDGDYIYVGTGNTQNKVYKYSKSTLTKIVESSTFGASGAAVYAIAVVGDYVYVGGQSGVLKKLRKSSLVAVNTLNYTAGDINAIDTDGSTYLYMGGFYNDGGYKYTVWKVQLSNLTKVAESGDYGYSIETILYYDNYVYAGGMTTRKVYKYDTDLNKLAESGSYGDTLSGLIYLEGYAVYPSEALARVTGLVHRYRPGHYSLEILFGDITTEWNIADYLYGSGTGAPSDIYDEYRFGAGYVSQIPRGYGYVSQPPVCPVGTVPKWTWDDGWRCVSTPFAGATGGAAAGTPQYGAGYVSQPMWPEWAQGATPTELSGLFRTAEELRYGPNIGPVEAHLQRAREAEERDQRIAATGISEQTYAGKAAPGGAPSSTPSSPPSCPAGTIPRYIDGKWKCVLYSPGTSAPGGYAR